MSRPNSRDRRRQSPADAVTGRASRFLFVAITLLAVFGGIAVWWMNRSGEVVAQLSEGQAKPERPPTPAIDLPSLPFRDVTEQSGLEFIHENGAAGEKLLPEMMGGGVGVLDYDTDGDFDILFVNSTRWPWDRRDDSSPATCALYENDGTGNFTDASEKTGFNVSLYGMGCAVGDYDNDGDPDVYLSAVGPNRLFRNDGGRFVDVTREAGVAGESDDWSTSCGWFDYDNDGRLDLFVCNYIQWSRQEDLARNFRLRNIDEPAYGRPQSFEGTFPRLFRNLGDGRFEDIGEAAGLHVRHPTRNRPLAKSLGVTFADFDRDLDLDVVVANDTVQNLLFENRGDRSLRETGAQAGIAFDRDGAVRGAMGIDVATVHDGRAIAVAIGNFSNEMTALYVTSPGEMSFTDEAPVNGIGPATDLELTFGVLLADFDLDGRCDLFAVNGHLEPDINRVVSGQHYEQPPQLFWNCSADEKTSFCELGERQLGRDFVEPIVGRGAAHADFDGDGDLDLIVTTVGGPPRLLRNDLTGDRRWIRLKLVGTRSNRDAIGAAATIALGERVQTQTVMPTRSYLSQVEPVLTFGFGPGDLDRPIERVEIAWPSGQRQTIERLEPRTTYTITEPDG